MKISLTAVVAYLAIGLSATVYAGQSLAQAAPGGGTVQELKRADLD